MSGRKDQAILTLPTPGGLEVRVPVGTIEGVRPGPRACVIGGVHGTEYAGMEAALRIYRRLHPDLIAGKLTVILVADTASMLDWGMFGSRIDGKDLSRTYPGSPDGTYTEVLAHLLWDQVLSRVDALIDLHGGEFVEGMVPYVGCPRIGDASLDQACQAMARAFDLPYVSTSDRPGSLTDLLRIPSIYSEVGERGRRDETSIGLQVHGVENVLRHLGMLEGAVERRHQPQLLLTKHWLRATETALFYAAVEVGQPVFAGQVIGELRNWFGDKMHDVIAPVDGVLMSVYTGRGVRENGFIAWIGEVS